MAKASDNPFPSILLDESAAPTTPASGYQRLFVDSADSTLKLKDDAGVVTPVGAGAGFGAWTNYTPALTATTTNPTLGTGSTIAGRYRTVGDDGVEGVVHIAFGTSGVAAGSGEYQISLPAGITLPSTLTANPVYGSAYCFDNSGGVVRTLTVARAGSSLLRLYVDSGTLATNALPWVWAASDLISLRFAGEAVI